jgi:hypothetical protein
MKMHQGLAFEQVGVAPTFCHNQCWAGILILIYQLDKGKYKISWNISATQRHIRLFLNPN